MRGRRRMLAIALGAGASMASGQDLAARKDPVHESTVTDLQAEMTAGRLTSVQLVDLYLARIAAYAHHGEPAGAGRSAGA